MQDFIEEFLQISDNHIWFYADIEPETCLHLNAALKRIDIKNVSQPDAIIHLHINSYGGSVIAALSTIDTIRRLRCKVYTYVDGGAASAATLISCVGAKRFIGKHSCMLIHQVRGESGGKLDEMEDEIKNTRQFMDIIKSIYKTYTNMNSKKMNELLKTDIWLDSSECLKLGLVDYVL